MISNNDLHDITAAFIAIRSNPKYELNNAILDKIVQVLKLDDQTSEHNQIRKAIASIKNLNQDRWYYVYHNNVYVYNRFLRNKQIYQLLIKACETLKQLLEMQDYERSHDLVDSIHCLPDIIVENNFSITKSYWKTHIENYRNKWDKTFLIEEQKALKK